MRFGFVAFSWPAGGLETTKGPHDGARVSAAHHAAGAAAHGTGLCWENGFCWDLNPWPHVHVVSIIERRSRVHVEVWANGEKLCILNRFWGVTEEFLKAPCGTFTAIGKCHNLDAQGQRATKENCRAEPKVEEERPPGARLMSWRQR